MRDGYKIIEDKLYKKQLLEFFGPNPKSIYVKYYNMWADDINKGMRECVQKSGGDKLSVAEHNICYFLSRLRATPKFVSNLEGAARSECKGKEKCINALMNFANSHRKEIPQIKQEINSLKKQIKQEKSGKVPMDRKKSRKKLRQKKEIKNEHKKFKQLS